MKQENNRKQSMGVGLLLQKVLALYNIQDSQVCEGEHGKPMVEGLEFNLSHSGNLVICAVSDKPVGCDIEEIRQAPKGVAERCFSDSEQVFVNSFFGEEYNCAFFRIWTMKESYVKMTGEGLGLPVEAYEVDFDKERTSLEQDGYAQVFRHGKMQGCHLRSLQLKGYIVSVCAEDCAPVEVIWELCE